jgi:uncharacterized membrane-anchored protein YhcB (DUF1043 family)
VVVLSLIFGVLIGGITVWFKQRHYRRLAREQEKQVQKWQKEAMRQKSRAEAMHHPDAMGEIDRPILQLEHH